VFANDGEASVTSWFLPKNKETGLELYAKGGNVRIKSLHVAAMRSVWPAPRP
jgi:fructan beta-fructosidase